MSSPIAIPRSEASSSSASSSLTGKYVPVHKRVGATPSPATSPSSRSRSSSPSSRKNKPFGSRPVADYEHNHNDIPIHTTIPNIYSIADLLSLSSSPARLSPSQLTDLHDLLPFTYKPTPVVSASQQQRRRAGRNHRAQPKTLWLLATAPEELSEERRKRHMWGWHPAVHVEAQTWRHPVAIQA